MFQSNKKIVSTRWRKGGDSDEDLDIKEEFDGMTTSEILEEIRENNQLNL